MHYCSPVNVLLNVGAQKTVLPGYISERVNGYGIRSLHKQWINKAKSHSVTALKSVN